MPSICHPQCPSLTVPVIPNSPAPQCLSPLASITPSTPASQHPSPPLPQPPSAITPLLPAVSRGVSPAINLYTFLHHCPWCLEQQTNKWFCAPHKVLTPTRGYSRGTAMPSHKTEVCSSPRAGGQHNVHTVLPRVPSPTQGTEQNKAALQTTHCVLPAPPCTQLAPRPPVEQHPPCTHHNTHCTAQRSSSTHTARKPPRLWPHQQLTGGM